jgi:hypothetical protein
MKDRATMQKKPITYSLNKRGRLVPVSEVIAEREGAPPQKDEGAGEKPAPAPTVEEKPKDDPKADEQSDQEEKPKRKPGRPRKNPEGSEFKVS